MLDGKDSNLVSAVFKLADRLAADRTRTSRHTVVAGVRSKSGAMYFGINCDSIHGTCAEVVAYANAALACDADVEAIVAVLIDATDRERVIAPCGNCRQIFSDFAPGVSFILCECGELRRIPVSKLIPCPYRHEEESSNGA